MDKQTWLLQRTEWISPSRFTRLIHSMTPVLTFILLPLDFLSMFPFCEGRVGGKEVETVRVTGEGATASRLHLWVCLKGEMHIPLSEKVMEREHRTRSLSLSLYVHYERGFEEFTIERFPSSGEMRKTKRRVWNCKISPLSLPFYPLVLEEQELC